MSTNGLFGPGIFGTGIDLSALDEDTAHRLGIFYGEQIRDAEQRGYQRATDAMRPVVEAARAWRVMRAETPTTPKPESAALIAAVDALDGAP